MELGIFLKGVVPALGAAVSCLMYMSPLSAVRHANNSKMLGDLNPLPFAITMCSSTVWFVYGLLKRDVFVMSPNVIGIVLALFSVLSTYPLASEWTQKRIRALLCSECLVLLTLGVCSSFWATNAAEKIILWGMAGNVTSICYFAAPLSTMTEVIRTRNSASILRPLTTMNTTSALLWTVYGWALEDTYIYVPNSIGLGLSLAQLCLACLFPSKKHPSGSTAQHQMNVQAHGQGMQRGLKQGV